MISPLKGALSNSPALILNYHHIVPNNTPMHSLLYGYSHRQSSFESQLIWLSTNLKYSTDFDAPQSFVITFDDCSMSTYKLALPLLNKYGIKAYFFVVESDLGNILWIDKYFAWLSYVPKGNYKINDQSFKISDFDSRMRTHYALWKMLPHEFSIDQMLLRMDELHDFEQLFALLSDHKDRLHTIDVEEISRLKNDGHFVGFHSQKHQQLSTLSSEKLVLECSPRHREYYNCNTMAIPFGGPSDYNEVALQELKRQGFEHILLNHPAHARDNVYGRLNLPDTASKHEIRYKVSQYLNEIK
jgi:peptidoglycan/xylan/chitin deacetylase (PgdA/CDA1 family)